MSEPTIIYEADHLLAINKPAGMEVLEVGEWARAIYPEARLAHRLDRDTTGVLLIAKDEVAYESLKNLFQTRAIQKKYLALVYGQPKNDEGVIDWPIGRSRRDPRRRLALPVERHQAKGVGNKWREALTEYRVLEKFPSYSLLEASPHTGRTHQIRVHLKALGYPIVADRLYAPASLLVGSAALPIERQALHATSLEFILPDGQLLKLTAELPPDFAATLAALRKTV